MPLDEIILVRRRSPDWRSLASDHESGLPIDASRYRPRVDVPGFPADIGACVQIWNDIFPLNFFRCRQVLTEISERTLRQISNAIMISEDEVCDLPGMITKPQSLLFFYDDDDLFAPNMFDHLAGVDFGLCDIAVFPLVRLGEEIFTFVRNDRPARMVLGERRNFGHRFQTNNYGISSRISVSGHLAHLKDHVLGSIYANQQNLTDTYFDILISATNKTPCSANIIGGLPSNKQNYRAFIRRYVDNLQRLTLPPGLEWLATPLNETIQLFGDI